MFEDWYINLRRNKMNENILFGFAIVFIAAVLYYSMMILLIYFSSISLIRTFQIVWLFAHQMIASKRVSVCICARSCKSFSQWCAHIKHLVFTHTRCVSVWICVCSSLFANVYNNFCYSDSLLLMGDSQMIRCFWMDRQNCDEPKWKLLYLWSFVFV